MWTASPTLTLDDPTAIIDPALIASGRTLLDAMLAAFPAGSQALADAARLRTGGRFMDEWRSAAELLGIGWRSIALANITYDTAIITLGCSTAAIATESGPILARNLDWWPENELARASVGVRVGHWFAATWPGFSGVVTGMSDRGFAVALNAVELHEKSLPTGYPVLLMLRRVLEDALDFDHAVTLLTETRLLASCLLTVVGVRNTQRVVIERGPTEAALRRPDGDAPLIATNDYRLLYAPTTSDAAPIYQTTCARFDAMTVLAGALEDPTDAELLAVLTDEDVFQGITVQHTILRPSTGQAGVWVPSRLM
ncbi:MAG: hypothetical protein ACI8RZ_004112 [Myxococcota bacterium]|jgi:hypothetical protein